MLSAFLHDWLERGVWAQPTDLRLNDGRCWVLVKTLLLLIPGASVTWSGSVHMMTDAKRVDNLAGLYEFKSSTSELSQRYGSSFRVSVRASPRTARAIRRKSARMPQCQCTRSTWVVNSCKAQE